MKTALFRIVLPVLLPLLTWASSSRAMMDDNPLLFGLRVHELEVAEANRSSVHGEWWAGRDRNRLLLDFEGDRMNNRWQQTEVAALYSRSVLTYWNVRAGVTRLLDPQAENLVQVGLVGLLPYFVESEFDAALLPSGGVRVRTRLERELLITQRLVLTPEVELSYFDREIGGRGAGLHQHWQLRLGYQVKRELTPFVGVSLERGPGEPTVRSVAVGMRMWF